MGQSIHRLSAIVFTDIVGYTSLMGENEENALQILETNRKFHLRNFDKYQCTFHKQMGDGFLAIFDSVVEAVHACANILKSCKDENIELRIGIHEGEVIFKDDDVYGDEVNITSRIEQAAENGTIFISENIKRNVDNKSGMSAHFIREFDLKNVKDPVKIYKLDVDILKIPAVTRSEIKPVSGIIKHKKRITLFVWLLLLSVLFFIILNYKSVFQFLSSTVQGNQVVELTDKTLAVLPFENLSRNSELEYLGDGIADDIIINLSKIPDFTIISRSSSFKYKELNASLSRISRDLDVQNIIEGSFQVLNNDIRINIKLIHCKSGNVLLAETFNGRLDDIFNLQEKVATGITNSLVGSFKKFQTTDNNKKKVNLQAFKYYQMGQSLLKENYLYRNTIQESRKQFALAIIEDPAWQAPYVGMAESYFMEIHFGYKSYSGNKDSINYYISKASNINSEKGELYCWKGTAAVYSFDLKKAIKLFDKAIELNPNYPYTYYYIAWINLFQNNFDHVSFNINRAASLDPLNEFFKVMKPLFFSFSGRNDQAVNLLTKMLEIEPGNNTTLFILGSVYSNMGEYEKALSTLLRRSVGHNSNFMVAFNYGKTGQKDKAREILDYLLQLPEEKAPPASQIAIVYLGLEDYENAILWFQKSWEIKDQWTMWLKQSWSDPIKDDPRYLHIVNEMRVN